jgi:hypothetical protein
MAVQLGMHVSNARVHISKVPHVRAMMRLQDVLVGSVVNTCMPFRQASTIQLQCDVSTMDHSSGTVTMPCDSTARR